MSPRIKLELELLRVHYSNVTYKERGGSHWFRLGDYPVPTPWAPRPGPVVFSVTSGHPGPEPYGFFVPAALRHHGNPPQTTTPPHQPPFEGAWLFLSWAPVGWRATSDVSSGSNLWGWARSFMARFREGP